MRNLIHDLKQNHTVLISSHILTELGEICDSAAIIEAFEAGHYFGVPLLQFYGMSYEPRQAAAKAVPPFPHMLRWMR